MSTFTTDWADSGEIPPLPGEHHAQIHVSNQPGEYGARRLPGESTINATKRNLRQGQVYTARRLSAAETMIVRSDLTADPQEVADARLRPDEPFLVAYAPNWRETWINTGEIPSSTFSQMLDAGLQDPPTGPPPPLPPIPPKPAKVADDVLRVRRAFFEPGRRRTADSPQPIPARWAWGLIAYAAGLVSGAVLLGSVLAAVTA